MNRDEARQVWKDSGLTYRDVSEGALYTLARMLTTHLGASKDATLMMFVHIYHKQCRPFKLKTSDRGGIEYAEINVDGPYFNEREGITFNRDGFIGLAGWASNDNVQPFLEAFCEWCRNRKGVGGMTVHPSKTKSSSKEKVAPPRFESTEDGLARLLFGSDSAAAELGSKFEEANADA